MMKIKATPITAALAGASMAVLLNINGILSSLGLASPRPDTGFGIIGGIFFFATVIILVIGTEHIRFDFGYPFTREYWQQLPYVAFRMFCWFVGASVTAGTLHSVLKK